MWMLLLNCSFLESAFNALLSLCRSFDVDRIFKKKQITLISALRNGFFGTVSKTMMTAMIHRSPTDSDNVENFSPSPPPPHSKTSIIASPNNSKNKFKNET